MRTFVVMVFSLLAALCIGPAQAAEAKAAQRELSIAAVQLDYGQLAAARTRGDALIVANFDYEQLPDLKTPRADAALVAAALRSRGIPAQTLLNATRADLVAAIAAYAQSSNKDVFILYYAGHAATIDGNSSVMLPAFRFDATDRNTEFEPISAIVRAVGALGYKKVLVIFDACRDVISLPGGSEVNRGPSTTESQAGTRGPTPLASRSVELAALQRVEYAISFSAGEGQTALDTVNGENSPFAEAFATNLREKQTIFDAIVETRRVVRSITQDRQRPTLEVSWDEDFALATSLIESATYRFWDPAPSVLSAPADEVEADPQGFTPDDVMLRHSAIASDGCALAEPVPNSAVFSFSSLDCLISAYTIAAAPGAPNGTGFYFPTFETHDRDGALSRCETASFVTDLDADGRPETATFGSNRYGGYLSFERDGHTATYYSPLGCSFSQLSLYDLDQNGVGDIIVEFACPDGECLAVLSGERLVSGMDGDFVGDATPADPIGPFDHALEQYFKANPSLGILGGLAPVALFYDAGLKQSRLLPGAYEYTTYTGTWERGLYPDNSMVAKRLSIAPDGTARLDSISAHLSISGFATGRLLVRR